MRVIFIIYEFISIISFFVLSYQDWNETPNIISFLICCLINIFLSEIWPIYWGILHWIY
nr:MAG TPA: hypothetical protein [Caudoviricetes sp.]